MFDTCDRRDPDKHLHTIIKSVRPRGSGWTAENGLYFAGASAVVLKFIFRKMFIILKPRRHENVLKLFCVTHHDFHALGCSDVLQV